MPLAPPVEGFVRMTHSALPGAEVYAHVDAYRAVWYAEGWRSIDDPDFVGGPGPDIPPFDADEIAYLDDLVFGGSPAATSVTTTNEGLLVGANAQAMFAAVEAQLRMTSRRTTVEHDLVTFSDAVQNVMYAFTIPGAQAVGGHRYRAMVLGDLQNTSGSDKTITFRVRKNGVSLQSQGPVTVPSDTDVARRRGWRVGFTVYVDNDFDLNMAIDEICVGPLIVASVAQGDNISDRFGYRQQAMADTDWALAVTFDVTAQWSASPGVEIRRQIAEMETVLTTPG